MKTIKSILVAAALTMSSSAMAWVSVGNVDGGGAFQQGDETIMVNKDGTLTYFGEEGMIQDVGNIHVTEGGKYVMTFKDGRTVEVSGNGLVDSEGNKGVDLKDTHDLVQGNTDLIDSNKTEQDGVNKSQAENNQEQQTSIDELYNATKVNSKGIAKNSQDIQTLFGEVSRLDTRIDQTQALGAATVNARPMVANGETAFGMGMGYSGNEGAIAVGAAHSFADSGWSISGTLSATQGGVVIGSGVQFAF